MFATCSSEVVLFLEQDGDAANEGQHHIPIDDMVTTAVSITPPTIEPDA